MHVRNFPGRPQVGMAAVTPPSPRAWVACFYETDETRQRRLRFRNQAPVSRICGFDVGVVSDPHLIRAVGAPGTVSFAKESGVRPLLALGPLGHVSRVGEPCSGFGVAPGRIEHASQPVHRHAAREIFVFDDAASDRRFRAQKRIWRFSPPPNS